MKLITAAELVPEGSVVLMLDKQIMWFGPLNAPWDDVGHDCIIVNPVEFERMVRGVREPDTNAIPPIAL